MKRKQSNTLLPALVINYSGGVKLAKLHSKISPLKKGNFDVLQVALTGDAPKDFISLYQYNGKLRRDHRQDWTKYIAKVGHKWYPLESITEYLMNKIGEALGFNMANSKLLLVNNQVRFLSEYFLEADEELVHGAEIFSSFLSENDTKFIDEIEQKKLTQTLLTFDFTKDAIDYSFPAECDKLMEDFVKMLLLDAIIGNNDRHFYNWGIVKSTEKGKVHTFSPIYDTARGLFWNDSEEVILKKYYNRDVINQTAVDKYINKSRPKVGWEGKQNITHFELIQYICEQYQGYRSVCASVLNEVGWEAVEKAINETFKPFYTSKRYDLILHCLQKRFCKLQTLLKI